MVSCCQDKVPGVGRRGLKWEGVKRYRLLVIKDVCSGDVHPPLSMVKILTNTLLPI